MLAYHNDPAVRKMFIDRVEAHAKADEITKGTYWKNGKGCAFGCMFHSDDYRLAETEAGIPVALARLQDRIFEGLEKAKAKKWVVDFPSAIKTGQDLSLVSWQFLYWLQKENLKNAKKQKMPQDVIAAIKQCIDVLYPLTKGLKVDVNAAQLSAEAAEWSAWAAAWSKSAKSAEAAVQAATWAKSAAAAEAAAWTAAWAYEEMAKKLLLLIQQAPMPERKPR